MSKLALAPLTCNPQRGARPSLEFRRVEELAVDPAYQRSIDNGESRGLIRKIATYWDWSLCQPLSVARQADGSLNVVDGQHRLAAAVARGDIYDLPCVVVQYASKAEEAAAFVALNQQRRPLSRTALFKAAVAAEDEAACAISRLLTDAGLTITPSSDYAQWKPGMLSNIGGIERVYRVLGTEVCGGALRCLARAFDGTILRYAGTLFPAIAALLSNGAKADVLVTALRRHDQDQWMRKSLHEAARSGVERRSAVVILFNAAYHDLAGEVAASISSAAAGPGSGPAPSFLKPAEMAWCDQCDRKVSGAHASACADRFCKLKQAKAA